MNTTFLAIALGAVLGAAWEGALGALTGGWLAWLTMRTRWQAQELAALRKLVEQRGVPGASAAAPVPPAGSAGVPAGMPGLATVGAPGLAPEPMAAPVPALAKAAATATATASAAAEPVLVTAMPDARGVGAGGSLAPAAIGPSASWGPPDVPDLIAQARAWLLGGNTIVKVGIGILFMGLAFLAKFAAEQVQLSIGLRLAGIGAVGGVLLGLGWRLRAARPGYAQVLQGGAVAVLYLTLFVAFRFYNLVSPGWALVWMALVAALAAALAVLQDARPLAVVGALGGFAAPLLVSTGSGNAVLLFSYYLVLDLGIAAVAWHKTWRVLNLIGFVATFVVATGWGVLRYSPEHYGSSQAFLIAYFLVFNAILLMPARHPQQATDGAAPRADIRMQGCLMFGLPTISFVLQHGLVRDMAHGAALSALAMAVFYLAMARLLRTRQRLALTVEACQAVATVFLALVAPFALQARSTAGAWALEGAGLVWLGLRQARLLQRLLGYLLLLLSGAALFWGQLVQARPSSLFNDVVFNALLLVVGSLVAAHSLHRASNPRAGGEPVLGEQEVAAQPGLLAWATGWAVLVLAWQIATFGPPGLVGACWLVGGSALALVFTLLSARLQWPQAAVPAMLHAPLLALVAAGLAVRLADPLAQGGWWAWPVALAAHLLLLRWAGPAWPAAAQTVLHALGAVVLAALGALQGRAITAAWGEAGSAWAWLGWLVVPAVLLGWLVRPAAAQRWPVRAMPWAYQVAAAGVMTAGLLLWVLWANLASNGAAGPLPYLPLLNPLDVGVAVALLAAWRWLHSGPARQAVHWPPALPAGVLGVLGFVWLHAMLLRGFHHFAGLPLRLEVWVHALAVQTGITLLWASTALGLMWFSARRALRLPWRVGAALLAAVVLKLLLVDLAGTGTIMRIVSFIGVGLLMLVIAYVAPLPAPAQHGDRDLARP